jgi:hypothetical protein
MNHKLSEVNEEERTGMCSVCGPTKLKMRDKSKPISGRYRCNTVYKFNQMKTRSPYHTYRKDHCEHCDFKPVHISQLDVDHIDGDRFNNDPANLQTLCANCHRLKTHLSGDSNSGIN